MSDSSFLSTPTPTPDSVLSPALSWRRLSAGGDDGEERKGKKRGWGKLPLAILNHILGFVLADTDHFKTPYLAARNLPDLASPELEYIAVLAQRKWMSEVKNVCFHWRGCIIQHPWWVSMALTQAGQVIHDFHFDRLTRSYHNSSSGGPFPFFQAHYILDGHVCYVCRISHPDIIRRCCHSPDSWMWTPRLGIVELCGHHALRTCANCLQFIDGTRPPAALALVSSARGDRNEEGQSLSSFDELVCAPCRSLSLARAINVVLHNTARGSRWTGKARNWRSEPGFVSYVQHGNFGLDVFATAQQIIERAWLVDHTCFNELQDDFDQALNLEARIRDRFMATGEANQPERLVNMMRGLLGWSEDKCWNEIRRKGALWDREREQGVDSGMSPFQVARSAREWYERQKDRAIRHWIGLRIAYGFWWTPSEEIRQLVELGHTSLPLLDRSADWVFPPDAECDDVDISNAMFERHGLIDLEVGYDDEGDEDTKFFPPSALLVSLNELFHQQLYRRVLPALGELVKNLVEVWEGEQRAEEAARDYGLENILMDLQIKESWVKSRPPGRSKSVSPRFISPSAVVSAPATRKSPRIEVRIEHPPPHRILQVQEDDRMSISDDSDDSDLATEIDDDVGRRNVPSTAQISWVRDMFIPECIRNKDVPALMEVADKVPALRGRVEEAIMEVVMKQSADDLQPAPSDDPVPEDAGNVHEANEKPGEMEVEVEGEVEKEEVPSTINSPIGPHSAIPSEKTRSSSEGTNDAMPITPPDAPTRTLPDVVHVAEEGDAPVDTAMVDPHTVRSHPHPTPQVAKPPQLPSSSEASTPNSSSSSASLFEETRIVEKQSAPSPPDIRAQDNSINNNDHHHNDHHDDSAPHEAEAPPPPRKLSRGSPLPDWVVPYDLIPWIPAPDLGETGMLAEDTIMKAWWDARGWLRECRCSICERGKKRMRDEEAGKWHPRILPGMEGVWDVDGKKRRIF